MVILDPKWLLYLFPFCTLRPNVNTVVNVLAIEHWLLLCGGHLKNSYRFWLNVQLPGILGLLFLRALIVIKGFYFINHLIAILKVFNQFF